MKIELKGRIDSNNAAQVEKSIRDQLAGLSVCDLTLDMSGLDYISSAGLRLILRLKKNIRDLRITEASPEVYDILEMTGFTEMMPVEKAYRVVSVEGCEVIGRGANGTIYRIDQDNVVKVYNKADALGEIRNEREMAKLALILGIPTAISYDVVRVGDSYGSVFELLNARSFSEILAKEPEKMDWCVREAVEILKRIHGTEVPEGKLPDMKNRALSWASFMRDYLPAWAGEELLAMVEAIPRDDHMIHGDFHTKNLELQDDEVLLIDMDTLAVGNPIFDLASMFNSFVGFSEWNHEVIRRFQGFDYETGAEFWRKSLEAYLDTHCEAKILEVEDKARILGYARMIRRSIRRGGLDAEDGRAEIEFWKEKLLKLLEKTDTLVFRLDELEIAADTANLLQVQDFVGERLEKADCPLKTRLQVDVAVEEIFVNIASYAYGTENGKAAVRVEIPEDKSGAAITFTDRGVPYNPLAKEDPDITLSAMERKIGGLGVFMTKKIMDDMRYEYRDGMNILTMKKHF